jgi:hypothetical protein
MVVDTGIGIAKEDLPRIGQPFEQIESHQSKKHRGTGLGLALSKSLIALHGGALQLDSELGKGTTVTITLPFNGADENASEPRVEEAAPRTEPRRTSRAPEPSPVDLLADDDDFEFVDGDGPFVPDDLGLTALAEPPPLPAVRRPETRGH